MYPFLCSLRSVGLQLLSIGFVVLLASSTGLAQLIITTVVGSGTAG
ncbi:hypothetical protein IC229_34100 [Spirosoma sp. BT702]|uniref:Uncharacterized protein n=1 Tax=Spirosoma profusum TaxID=2771354 RepID=A0A927AWJ6_9BACT|nr:hypothetical protein [Spirosoma profusum]MBD2705691.1 hypothetical protein [Spirosoma profusum]